MGEAVEPSLWQRLNGMRSPSCTRVGSSNVVAALLEGDRVGGDFAEMRRPNARAIRAGSDHMSTGAHMALFQPTASPAASSRKGERKSDEKPTRNQRAVNKG